MRLCVSQDLHQPYGGPVKRRYVQAPFVALPPAALEKTALEQTVFSSP